jgi:hypothetical protein
MNRFTLIASFFLSSTCFAQQASNKTFFVSSDPGTPLLYTNFVTKDISSGGPVHKLFGADMNFAIRKSGFMSYQNELRKTTKDDAANNPVLGGSVACLAYDAKSNRLFYVPQQISELRYMDLKEGSPSFTCLESQSFHLLHDKDDVANQISRMTIGADGFGYALSNDGEHLIRFSTQGNPVIQDLGVLVDNPKNTILVRSSCTSWGGDMVGAADGSLYLISMRNHVFKISLPNKQCDYIGMIRGLPEAFTSNGAAVDENGALLISCGTSYGKNFSPLYKVDMSTLEAMPVNNALSDMGNISDMASSNLLFRQNDQKKATGSDPVFTQKTEADLEQMPVISIFPNPVTHNKFQVKTSNLPQKDDYRMLLLDIHGNKIMDAKMSIRAKSNTQSFSFPARNAKGVYVLQIMDAFNRSVFSQQLIVE